MVSTRHEQKILIFSLTGMFSLWWLVSCAFDIQEGIEVQSIHKVDKLLLREGSVLAQTFLASPVYP